MENHLANQGLFGPWSPPPTPPFVLHYVVVLQGHARPRRWIHWIYWMNGMDRGMYKYENLYWICVYCICTYTIIIRYVGILRYCTDSILSQRDVTLCLLFLGVLWVFLKAVCNVVPLPCQQHYNYGNYTFRDANASNFQSIPFWIPASTFSSKVKQIFVSKTGEWAAKFTRHQLYISACHWVKPSWTWSIVLMKRRASSPITPPETNSSPLKISPPKPQRKVSSSNHAFSGAKC